MHASDERDLDGLRPLDPTLRDAPPAPGSPRYNAILERAMTQTIPTTPTVSPPDRTAVRIPSRRRTWWAAAATAAAASVLAVTAVVVGGSPQSASAAVLAAAERTGQATSLRMVTQLPPVDQDGKGTPNTVTQTGEVNGADFTITHRSEPSGDSLTVTVIGDMRYYNSADGTTSERIPAKQRRTPFAQAARNVFRTAADASDITEVGKGTIRGVDTTHYRLTVKPSAGSTGPVHPLAKLPDTELDWFGVAGLIKKSQADVVIDLWVAEGLIRRSDLSAPADKWRQSTEYFDFGKPITITAPTGS